MSGTNSMPLGARRRGFEDLPPSEPFQQTNPYAGGGGGGGGYHRGFNDHYSQSGGGSAPGGGASSYGVESSEQREGRPAVKQKKTWGSSEYRLAAAAPIPPGLSNDQIKELAIHLRIDEITRRLRSGDFFPPEAERSPSPRPTYGPDGRRSNTREYRYRRRLEDERHKMVAQAWQRNPNYKPPHDYKRPSRTADKVYVPYKEFPEVNFIGQLLGPRGSSLKRMESESGAKISIRGKGSIKEGKGRPQDLDAPGMDEEMHCLVLADHPEKVAKAVAMITEIIETAASTPELDNDRKRQQLRHLAELNGTLRDDENALCLNCGKPGHRRFECKEQSAYVNNVVCHNCGGKGHIARDCGGRRAGGGPGGPPAAPAGEHDQQYQDFMADISGSNRNGSAGGDGQRSGHYGPGPGGPARPHDGGGGAAPWKATGGGGDSSGGAAPWAAGGGGGHHGGTAAAAGGHYGGGGGHSYGGGNGGARQAPRPLAGPDMPYQGAYVGAAPAMPMYGQQPAAAAAYGYPPVQPAAAPGAMDPNASAAGAVAATAAGTPQEQADAYAAYFAQNPEYAQQYAAYYQQYAAYQQQQQQQQQYSSGGDAPPPPPPA